MGRLLASSCAVTANPTAAASSPATVTAVIEDAKLAVVCVMRPTPHMARAPTREPAPPSNPAAVETCSSDTPCATVRSIAYHIPIAKLAIASMAIAASYTIYHRNRCGAA